MNNIITQVRKEKPLVHCITNYVTVNDCANILLACGASPLMADEITEMEDIVSICDALYLNIGTINKRTEESMILAGKIANKLGKRIVYDPVGAGASKYRSEVTMRIINELKIDVIRANLSEIKAISKGIKNTRGVDATIEDEINEDTLEECISFIKEFAISTGAVVSVSGMIDIVSDGHNTYCIKNGHPMMSRITGTGCQLSALTAAMAAFKDPFDAASEAVMMMGIAGEAAGKKLKNGEGNASFRTYIIDAIYNMTDDKVEEEADYEMR